MAQHPKLYIVPTDRWYIERTVWLIAGVVLLAATALALWVHPAWVLLVVITAYRELVAAAFFSAFVITVLLNRVAFWARSNVSNSPMRRCVR